MAQAQRLRHVLPLNPATGVVLLFRAAIVGQDEYFVRASPGRVAWTVVLLVVGLLIHRRYDRVFADLL